MEKWASSSIIVFLFVLSLSTGRSLAQQVIKYGSLPIVVQMPLYSALDNGFFEQEGIKIEQELIPGGAALIPALVGGSLHMGHSTYISVFPAREQGFDITVVAPFGQPADAGIVVLAESPIKSGKDLEGKTVALNLVKSVNWLYAIEWLALKGADPLKVNWLELPFPNMVPAVRGRKVDAAFPTDPFLRLELERGGLRNIGNPYNDVDPEMEISGIIAKESWARSNGDLVERFARGLYKGTDYLNSNPKRWPDMVVKYLKMPPEMVLKMKVPVYSHPIKMRSLQIQADLAQKWGLTKKKVQVKDLVWPTALR